METILSIAEVARRTGLTAYTLRYYEKMGLIASVNRTGSGQRRYMTADLDWIAFLMRLRATGMSIQGMQAFARLRSKGNQTASERRALLEQHLSEVQARIVSLQQSAQALKDKIKHYRQIEAHPLLDAQPIEGAQHDPKPLRKRPRQTERD